MPSRKRTVKYEENQEPDGDRNVEVSEEQSESSLTEQDDERYTPSSNN